MSYQQPTWASAWDLLLKTGAVIGALFLYAMHGCDFNNTRQELQEFKLATERDAVDQKRINDQLSGDLLSLQKERERLELDSARSPRVVTKIRVSAVPLPYAQTEYEVLIQLENTGNVPTEIRSVSVAADAIRPTPFTEALLLSCKQLYELNQQLRDPDLTDDRRRQLIENWRILHEPSCPHGRLFAVSAEGDDFRWERLSAQKRQSDFVLSPGQCVAIPFVFLLTDVNGQLLWLRFRPSITSTEHESAHPMGDVIVLAGESQSPYVPTKSTVSVERMIGNADWQLLPGVPLMPLIDNDKPQQPLDPGETPPRLHPREPPDNRIFTVPK